MSTIQYLTATIDSIGQRLDNYLLSRLKGLPKSRLYRIIRKGEVRVNKKRVKPDYRLQEGDIIRVPPLKLSPPTETKTPNEKLASLLEKAIIFEDKNFLALNKPSGLAVHGGSGIQLGVIETLRAIRPQQKYLELVHRLDRDTSGCLLIAKKSSILKELHELLRSGAIKKTYLALVVGHWPKSLQKIDVPLYKNQLQSGERIVQVHQAGKICLTEFRPIDYFSDTTLVEAMPITGRTHQIRVHAQYAKHPIIGDEKYGDKLANKKLKALGCRRLFLHASQLNFILASTEQTFALKAELPYELKCLLKQLGNTNPLI
ncbi:MAG: 23S rRNA pseudouridine(955/2504/2580) synthase RluC [Pseudomonadota bacterium]